MNHDHDDELQQDMVERRLEQWRAHEPHHHSRMLGIAEAYLIMIRAIADNPNADHPASLRNISELVRRALIITGYAAHEPKARGGSL